MEQNEPHQQAQQSQAPLQSANTPPALNQQPTSPRKGMLSAGGLLSKLAGILSVIAGLFIGFMIGGIISFGCYKSDCNAFQESAPIVMPLASLLFTVPLAVKAFKK